jgi:tRNA(Ile)-lysidine synthase
MPAAATAVHAALAALPRGRWLLAVSGGRDSMVLLDAMGSARAHEVAAVATFDHGTGAAARRACALVEREGEARALTVITGRAPARTPRREAAWRVARLTFLEGWARELGATVVTAHTRDDQVETVVQRLLRGAGPRGLAAMRAPATLGVHEAEPGAPASGWEARLERPLLAVPRAVVAGYAAVRGVPFIEDPSNTDPRHQRNRVRHELLPALERARPGFGEWCLALAGRAAAWRGEVERFVDALGVTKEAPRTVVVPASPLRALGRSEWAVLWPELASRAGVVMDRRGIARASAWAPGARAGGVVQLSGGARIARTGATFVIRGNDGTP